MFARRCQNFVDGRWRDSDSGRTFAVHNPADLRQVCHEYPLSTKVDAAAAVEAAAGAFPAWRARPLVEKAGIMRRAAQIIRERRREIAAVVTLENGKLLKESLAEVDAAALELEYQIGEGERQFGRVGDGYRAGVMAYSRREPIGVVSAIIPWNFPFNVPFRKLGPALMAGNAAVLKPASQTPAVGEIVVHILLEAGLPPGALQFVTGSGAELSEALVAHPLVRAVTFTGSTEVGRRIARAAADNFTRTQLEMGGKNPMVVLADADLDLAAEDAVIGAFSCAGQWCTATSRLVVERSVADALIERVLARVRALALGPGDRGDATIGPVAGRQQLISVLGHIAQARRQGAEFLTGGERSLAPGLEHGCFIEPAVVDNVRDDMDLARTEVFGPVLAAIRAASYEQALQFANDTTYGLSSSIYTRDVGKALHFVEHSEAGLTHVNLHSAYKEPQVEFGGVKQSGFGLPEAGMSGIRFFQEEKGIYIRK